MHVLGIESSCDETGVAIYEAEHGLIAQTLHSQITTHELYGGVVPELASRDHIKYIVFLVDLVLKQANLNKHSIDAIAYTAGPGLIGALLVGACFAKSFAFSLNKPAIAVHHLEAHILAAKLDNPALDFPFIALLVSGGHTQLIVAKALGDYTLIGDTLDDAVGEAFDKTAKLMGLSYPGGSKLATLANQCLPQDQQLFSCFPRPMTDRPGLDFSFSGLKTHALTTWNKSEKDDKAMKAVSYHFQQAVVDTLVIKCRRAIEENNIQQLVVAGGVGANHVLRQSLTTMMSQRGGRAFFPRSEYCTDNGAMVAYAGFLHFQAGKYDANHAITVKARWPLA